MVPSFIVGDSDGIFNKTPTSGAEGTEGAGAAGAAGAGAGARAAGGGAAETEALAMSSALSTMMAMG